MKLTILAVALAAFLAAGCSSPRYLAAKRTHILRDLSLGMTKQEVLMKLGDPDGAKGYANVQYLYYRVNEPYSFTSTKTYFVKFVDNVVAKYGLVTEGNQRPQEGSEEFL